jgi:hypothetical protein
VLHYTIDPVKRAESIAETEAERVFRETRDISLAIVVELTTYREALYMLTQDERGIVRDGFNLRAKLRRGNRVESRQKT